MSEKEFWNFISLGVEIQMSPENVQKNDSPNYLILSQNIPIR